MDLRPISTGFAKSGKDPDDSGQIDFKFQNIPFALNILDSLAGDDRFIDLRKRTRSHRMLTKVEEATEDQRKAALDEQSKFFNEAQAANRGGAGRIPQEDGRLGEPQRILDPRVKEQMMEQERIRWSGFATCKIASFEKDRNKKVKQSERELAAKIRGVQDRYKLLAVLLPPIPPILLAFFVFFHRRKAEQEGVDTRRLRYGRAHEQAASETVDNS